MLFDCGRQLMGDIANREVTIFAAVCNLNIGFFLSLVIITPLSRKMII